MNVIITDSAHENMLQIGRWIADDNPARALSFVSELEECCKTLGDMPYAYPVVPRYEAYAVRRRIYRNYLIFYSIDGDNIYVLHVLNARQDVEAILFPCEPI